MRLSVSRLMFAVMTFAFVAFNTAPASAADDLTEMAGKVLNGYIQATLDGPDTLAPWLAPEFQIMRSNGAGYDRTGYLTRSVGTIKAAPDFSHEEVVATRSGDILVTRYMLKINEVIEGKPIAKRAPRLTVFRMIGGAWKVVAHSNFGAGH